LQPKYQHTYSQVEMPEVVPQSLKCFQQVPYSCNNVLFCATTWRNNAPRNSNCLSIRTLEPILNPLQNYLHVHCKYFCHSWSL